MHITNQIDTQTRAIAELLGHSVENKNNFELLEIYRELHKKFPFCYLFALYTFHDMRTKEIEEHLEPYYQQYEHCTTFYSHLGDFWLSRQDHHRALYHYLEAMTKSYCDITTLIGKISSISRVAEYRIKYAMFWGKFWKKLRVTRNNLKKNHEIFNKISSANKTLREALQEKKEGRKEGRKKGLPVRDWLRSRPSMPNFHYNAAADDEVALFEIEQLLLTCGTRPTSFYIVNVVWGHDFVKDMLEMSLPSLLSSGNLEYLCEDNNVCLVFYTTHNGAESVRTSEVFSRLVRYASIKFVYIEKILNKHALSSPYSVMASAHRHLLSCLAGTKSGIIFSAPDALIADGTLRRVEELLNDGYTYIFVNGTYRLDRDKCRAVLPRQRLDGSIALDSQTYTQIMNESKHASAQGQFIGERCHSMAPAILLWDIPGQGVLSHAMHLHPLAVRAPDKPVNSARSIDGDLLSKDESENVRIFVAKDSNSLLFTSFTPSQDKQWNLPGELTTQLVGNMLFEHADVFQRIFLTLPYRLFYVNSDFRNEMLWTRVGRDADLFTRQALFSIRSTDGC